MRHPTLFLRLILLLLLPLASARAEEFDVVVVGATPGGVAAAVTAARLGHTVALTEYHAHLGGMAASGLGKSDVETKEAIGGLWREFVGRVHAYYVKTYGPNHENVKLCRDGYYYEPSVAEKIFDAMVAEQPRIRVFRRHRLDSVGRAGQKVVNVRLTDRTSGNAITLTGGAFIDATYEGDLAAFAGARYRLGRESRAEFNELHAGVVYQDYETRTFLAGTTGEGDKRLPAYTYRLCLTKDPANAFVLTAPPPGYDRTRYLGYIDDWKAGRFAPPKQMRDGVGYYAPTFNTVVRALSMADLPNGKLDVNMNPRPLGFPFTEENYDYPEANWTEREVISERIRNLTLGLLWFLQNDPELPEEHRKLARQFHLAKDEFTDNGHFPWQLYVREARRVIGEETLSENDLILGPALGRTRLHFDSIAAGEYPIDSFPVRKREKGHDVALEGYILMLEKFTHPYQISYRIMVPKDVDGLLVPVAASTTHVAFSSIRLEPTWMALGQAAATAAHLALQAKVPLRRIDIATLQRTLLGQGQVITFFRDIDQKDPAYAALQYFGTRGFFPDYYARSAAAIDRGTAREWLKLSLGRKAEKVATELKGEGELSAAEFARVSAAVSSSGAAASATAAGPTVTRGAFAQMLFAAVSPAARTARIMTNEFIYERAPYPSCHASTIVETDKGDLVAAWFGGTAEKNPDVGIWVSRYDASAKAWTPGVEVANGVQPGGTRHPTWNPVLFQPRNAPLMLFYKVGPSPQTWWGMLRTSTDGGRTWSDAQRLPHGILGPIKNKPVQLADGTILCPTSDETDESPSKWTVHFERTTDLGKTWSATQPLNDGLTLAAIQPSILFHDRIGGAKLQAVGRTRQGGVFTISSDDAGKTWSAMSLLDGVPNPNAGTDAVTLKDGSHLLVCNPVTRGRTPLVVESSRDGRTWEKIVTLEDQPGEYSYPAIIQTSDGRVHITYTWKRERIKHVVLEMK